MGGRTNQCIVGVTAAYTIRKLINRFINKSSQPFHNRQETAKRIMWKFHKCLHVCACVYACKYQSINQSHTHTQTQLLCGLFPAPPKWAGARRNLLLDFYGVREDNTGRLTDHPDGRHSIRTNQWPISIIPHFYAGCPSCRNPPTLSWQAPNMLACIPSGVVQSINQKKLKWPTWHSYCKDH